MLCNLSHFKLYENIIKTDNSSQAEHITSGLIKFSESDSIEVLFDQNSNFTQNEVTIDFYSDPDYKNCIHTIRKPTSFLHQGQTLFFKVSLTNTDKPWNYKFIAIPCIYSWSSEERVLQILSFDFIYWIIKLILPYLQKGEINSKFQVKKYKIIDY